MKIPITVTQANAEYDNGDGAELVQYIYLTGNSTAIAEEEMEREWELEEGNYHLRLTITGSDFVEVSDQFNQRYKRGFRRILWQRFHNHCGRQRDQSLEIHPH